MSWIIEDPHRRPGDLDKFGTLDRKKGADRYRRLPPSRWNEGALSLTKLHRFAMCYLRTALGQSRTQCLLVRFWTPRGHRPERGIAFLGGLGQFASAALR